jgi:hypothetical protein
MVVDPSRALAMRQDCRENHLHVAPSLYLATTWRMLQNALAAVGSDVEKGKDGGRRAGAVTKGEATQPFSQPDRHDSDHGQGGHRPERSPPVDQQQPMPAPTASFEDSFKMQMVYLNLDKRPDRAAATRHELRALLAQDRERLVWRGEAERIAALDVSAACNNYRRACKQSM